MGHSERHPTQYCDERLRLRHKVQKLQWSGLDREAEQLAHEIEMLERGSRTTIAPRTIETD